MSANVEWEIPFTIRTTYGDLDLNDDANPLGLYLVLASGSSMGRPIRATVDEVPQGDGSIPHARFASGYEIELLISLWENRNTPACAEQARLMAEELGLHLNLALNDTGRILWTPTGLGDDRMMDEARVREISRWSLGAAGEPQMTVLFDSPFPYVIDATQTTTALADDTPTEITNNGNVPMFPVVKVYGPTSFFELLHEEEDERLVYDGALPGAIDIEAGDYVEFDFFRNTAYLNGSGGSRKAGIDIEQSDFWPLRPGVNTIECDGATADVLWNHSYA